MRFHPILSLMVICASSDIRVELDRTTKANDSGVRDEPNLGALPRRCSVHCRVSAHFRLRSESGSLSASVSFLKSL